MRRKIGGLSYIAEVMMFKKNKLDISFWYLALVTVMAISYLLLSRKDFVGMITAQYLTWPM